MALNQEPIRPHVYRPVPFLGVNDTDWPWILLTAGLSYVVAFLLDLKIYKIPLPFIIAVTALALAVLFFNWARVGRKPGWLRHTVMAKLTKAVSRRALGSDYLERVCRRPWLLDDAPSREELEELCA